MWDVTNSAAPVFRAKNVKHDALNMRVPVWVTDIAFVPRTDSHVVAIGTAYGQVPP